jgi:hypothetical protein
MLLDRRDIYIPTGKELFQSQSLFRGLRMEGEGNPFDFDFVFIPQLINTYRTEIAPGSNVIGEYFESWTHDLCSPAHRNDLINLDTITH